MTKKEILKELEILAGKLNYEVSYEALKKTATYVKSGFVILKDKRMILIDKELHADKAIGVILEAIKDDNIDDLFVKPYIKELIERFKLK